MEIVNFFVRKGIEVRVFHINAVYGVGSTGTIVKDIHQLSLRKGIDSYVAYSTSPVVPDNIINGYHIGNNLDKKMHAVLSRINGKQAYFSKKPTKDLLKKIESINPDIVVLHNLHSNYIHLNLLLSYLGSHAIQTIIVLHDCWFYTGGCFHYTNVQCTRWTETCGNCPKKRLDTPSYFFDCSHSIIIDRGKYFNKIQNLTTVGVSEWITYEASRTFLNKGRLLTIHNGVDFDFYKHIESDFRAKHKIEDKFVVLGMANKWLDLVNKKELELFSTQLHSDLVFVIAGCTDEQLSKIPPGVLSIPYIRNKDEMRKIYSACDVFVNCTREESLSLVNIEAQGCGTPVVTYNNTGVAETVDGKSGIRVATGDFRGLLDMTLRMKTVDRQEYSRQCRRFVQSKFDKYKRCMQYIDLFLSQ